MHSTKIKFTMFRLKNHPVKSSTWLIFTQQRVQSHSIKIPVTCPSFPSKRNGWRYSTMAFSWFTCILYAKLMSGMQVLLTAQSTTMFLGCNLVNVLISSIHCNKSCLKCEQACNGMWPQTASCRTSLSQQWNKISPFCN